MKNQDFNCSLTTNVTAEEAMAAISSVPDWWVTNFEGASQKLGDVFTARVCETFVTFNITGLSPIPKLCGRWSTAIFPGSKIKLYGQVQKSYSRSPTKMT